MQVWSLGLIVTFLGLGCQGEERGECRDGFVRKQGRWCVFDENAISAGSNAAAGSESSSGSGSSGSQSPGNDSGPDEEYIHDAPEPQVEFDLGQIEWAMEEAIRLVRWIDPAKVHDVYEAVELDGNEECPDYDEEYYEDQSWLAGPQDIQW